MRLLCGELLADKRTRAPEGDAEGDGAIQPAARGHALKLGGGVWSVDSESGRPGDDDAQLKRDASNAPEPHASDVVRRKRGNKRTIKREEQRPLDL